MGISKARPQSRGLKTSLTNLLRKWIKKHTPTGSLPPSSRPAFIPVQLEGTADRVLSRQDSVATVDLPAACDAVRGSEPKGATAFCSPARVSVSLPNGVKLALECGDHRSAWPCSDWAMTCRSIVSVAPRPVRLFVRILESTVRRVIFGKGAHNGRPFGRHKTTVPTYRSVCWRGSKTLARRCEGTDCRGEP